MELVTKSAQETKDLGKKFATDLITNHESRITNHATILALTGELGSGKTTFVQGLARGLGISGRVISPTFILLRKYKIKLQNSKLPPGRRPKFQSFYHIDLYRFENDVEKEVRGLGLEDIWNNPENIVAIEWAEKIADIILKTAIWIKFENLGGNRRRINQK